MSNNDLWCSKGKSQHHPVECPLDKMTSRERLIELIIQFAMKHNSSITIPDKNDAEKCADAILKEYIRKEDLLARLPKEEPWKAEKYERTELIIKKNYYNSGWNKCLSEVISIVKEEK